MNVTSTVGRVFGFSLWALLWCFVIVNCIRSPPCSTVCNLSLLPNVTAKQSTTYIYTDKRLSLSADRALNGKYDNHSEGDCAGTRVDGNFSNAWWSISLPDLAMIYKVNMMFREGFVRHHGYYVFISETEVDVDNLSSLTPVHHEENPYPAEQTIIQFPDGIQGRQMYIYLNKSNHKNTDNDYNNNVLDICEVEIWGNMNHCNCSGTEMYNSYIPWKNATLVCYNGSVINTSQIDHTCRNHNSTCDIKLDGSDNHNVSFRCYDCGVSNDNRNNNNNNNNSHADYRQIYRTVNDTTYRCLERSAWETEEPRCLRCLCPCSRLASQKYIKDPLVLKKKIEELKETLAVNRSKLSASVRRKTSSADDRTSSKFMGIIIGGVFTLVLISIVCSDLLSFRRSRKHHIA